MLTGGLALAAGVGAGLDLVLIAAGLVAYAGLVVGLGAVPAADVARVRGVLRRLGGPVVAAR